MNLRGGILALIAVLLSAPGPAAEIHVPADQPTIQAGIDAAADGDEVVVAPGTWTGDGNRDLDFVGKAIVVRSASGPDSCIIDCQGSEAEPHTGFLLQNWESRQAEIRGFAITNAWPRAIRFHNANATIRGNIIKGNAGGLQFGGDSYPLVAGNLIQDNHTDPDSGLGGGIYADAGLVMTHNIITGNSAFIGGGVCSLGGMTSCDNRITGNHANGAGGGIAVAKFGSGDAHLWNNLIAGNTTDGSGGGVWGESPKLLFYVVRNCTIVGNSAAEEGGAIHGTGWGGVHCDIRNSILQANGPGQLSGVFSYAVDYTNFEGGISGAGNIDADPLFVAGPQGGYYLGQVSAGQHQDSPCLDAGGDTASSQRFYVSDPLGNYWFHLDSLTSSTVEMTDQGMSDMGYHYSRTSSLAPTISARLTGDPDSGIVPFQVTATALVDNLVLDRSRVVAGRLDVTTANGTAYTNLRAGHTIIPAGGFRSTSWPLTVPALPGVLGTNTLRLVVQDVTPPPWNQPPYPASGYEAVDRWQVLGLKPGQP